MTHDTLEVPPMLDKVLVLSASAGAGYVRAAQAVERALTLSAWSRRDGDRRAWHRTRGPAT